MINDVYEKIGFLVVWFTAGWTITAFLWWLALRSIANIGNLVDFAKFTVHQKRNHPGGE